MRRLFAPLALIALLIAAAPLRADTIEDRVTAALTMQGFVVVSMERTWLGRLRVVAEDDAMRRELVFNPVTGEILRDLVVMLSAVEAQQQQRDRRDRTPNVAATVLDDPVSARDAAEPFAATMVPMDDMVLLPEPLFALDPE